MKNEKVQVTELWDIEVTKDEVRKHLPEAEYDTCDTMDEIITMSDGIRLATCISSPDLQKKWPVVLWRTPYVYFEWIKPLYQQIFAEHGYALALVYARGCVHSEGEFLAFEEDRDGREVLDWVGRQPWCDGNVVTMGASYCGNMQWAVADSGNPMLKTMFISVFGAESYDVFYHRGLFLKELLTQWSAQMHGDYKYRTIGPEEGEKLAKKAYSVRPAKELGEQLDGTTCQWYNRWASSWQGNENIWREGYWENLKTRPENLKIPVFLHGGWFDVFFPQMSSSYKRIPEDIKKKSVFQIGPWHHGGTPGGDLEYPNENQNGPEQLAAAIRWFDYIVKGKSYDRPVGVIDAYSIGTGKWESWERGISHTMEKRFYLDGSKSIGKGCTAQKTLPETTARVEYVYDPENPVPSKGGCLMTNHREPEKPAECSCLQEEIGWREDVISFVTEPLKENVKIAGSVKVRLFVSSDAPATAFTVKISEAFADGRTVNIRNDFTDIRWRKADSKNPQEYQPGEIVELDFDMPEIVWELKKGSNLRLDVTSSSDPLFPPHMNTLEPWGDAVTGRIAHQVIYTGKEYPSEIVLPVAAE